MSSHIVIDGNAFYEVDEECLNHNNRKKMENTEKGKLDMRNRKLENVQKKRTS